MDGEDAHNGRALSGAHCSPLARSIIGAEDEEFENDLDPTVDDQCSHFNSIELLKSKPTHLLVFLHHVILQFDCAPVLSYLHADLFRSLSTKETKKHFVDFYNNFLDKGAILRVAVPYHIAYELDRTRPDLISEDQQKRFAQEIQNNQTMEVLRQLEDFRKKRMMGMTPNELELAEVENHYPTDRVPREMKEKAVAERLLEKLTESNPAIVADEDKCSAIFGAVGFYMKQLGVKSRPPDSKKGKGFFRRKVPKKEDKSKVLSILRIGGSSNEVKMKLDNEGDKDRSSERRNTASTLVHRGSTTDGSVLPSPVRKPAASGPSISHGPETTEVTHSNIIVTPSPEASQPETGQTSSRSEQSVSDGGDVSPACPNVDIVWEPPAAPDGPVEESHEKDRRKTRSVRRSESLCVERCHSRRGGSTRAKQSRSRSDVDLQSTSTSQPPSPFPQPARLGDSPVMPVDGPFKGSGSFTQQEEVEPRLLELEQDPPNWRELSSSETLSKLTKKETKRQEVINELFATEHAHVRMLSVLQTVFSRPLEREGLMEPTELAAVFPSLDEILDMHYAFYENLKKLRQDDDYVVKQISTLLLNRFNGSEGEWFQKLTARFCSRQSWTLVQIKNKQKKEPRFNAFILEAESKPQCRRLQLKDIIPIEMQRLTKYPLLLENIAKSTEDNLEKENIQQAAECCRKILNHVNEEVKYMENLLTLRDYQRRLDTSGLKPSNELYSEYRGIDLTTRSMVYEGPLTWRVTKEKTLDVQGVLLGDMLVLLQKQDDKMLLKCQSKSNIAAQEGKQMLSPIIKLESAFLRDVATDRKAFYVIFTWESGAQIYELVAQSVAERKIWTDLIKSSVDELKKSAGHTLDRMRLGSVPSNSSALGYTALLNPPLSPTDNGTDVLKNSGQYKDSLTDEKFRHTQPSLIDCLTAKGFDLLAYSSARPERSGSVALDEVMSLKTLLLGSTCQSSNVEPEGESGGESAKQENDDSQSQVEEHNMESQDEKTRGEEQKAVLAPLVLSEEQIEEISRKLESLEDQVKRLQNVEDEYHRLQETLAKFTIQRGNYN
ncbi:rho guanine nucleotide exchange factor 1b isoform X2 [Tachysurus vachellii]|uniref:rho guanine nucleotide exchange factor 1b isoform X2 n=1 Tax=Tachysurus vachellii TaxID=175792 RepID=UPI00296B393B|nr:rho guanine nucleotide exchange factor 1b isoform X2 [Tachysurus vachellii]